MQVGATSIRAFPKLNPNRNEPKREGPAVTVFVGKFFNYLSVNCIFL